ncbi:uncharacterized protein [Typha latifolia]|uniref:uncharacterized protein isoform X8 n=1 Tax=Typha latifolia TaxID=4733 RepID=UPI003C30D218
MRGIFGKPQGTCSRVSIVQALLLVRCKDNNNENLAQESLRGRTLRYLLPLLVTTSSAAGTRTQLSTILCCYERIILSNVSWMPWAILLHAHL